MFEALQVRLPIADVLIIKTVDEFAQDKVWLIHIGLVVEQAWGNQVCLMYRATLDGNVRLEVSYVVDAEGFAEELLIEHARGTEFAGDLFSVVAPRVEVQAGI